MSVQYYPNDVLYWKFYPLNHNMLHSQWDGPHLISVKYHRHTTCLTASEMDHTLYLSNITDMTSSSLSTFSHQPDLQHHINGCTIVILWAKIKNIQYGIIYMYCILREDNLHDYWHIPVKMLICPSHVYEQVASAWQHGAHFPAYIEMVE